MSVENLQNIQKCTTQLLELLGVLNIYCFCLCFLTFISIGPQVHETPLCLFSIIIECVFLITAITSVIRTTHEPIKKHLPTLKYPISASNQCAKAPLHLLLQSQTCRMVE